LSISFSSPFRLRPVEAHDPDSWNGALLKINHFIGQRKEENASYNFFAAVTTIYFLVPSPCFLWCDGYIAHTDSYYCISPTRLYELQRLCPRIASAYEVFDCEHLRHWHDGSRCWYADDTWYGPDSECEDSEHVKGGKCRCLERLCQSDLERCKYLRPCLAPTLSADDFCAGLKCK
jgi:hypothetical protein